MVVRVGCQSCGKYYMLPDEEVEESASSIEVGEIFDGECPYCGHNKAKILTLTYLGKAK